MKRLTKEEQQTGEEFVILVKAEYNKLIWSIIRRYKLGYNEYMYDDIVATLGLTAYKYDKTRTKMTTWISLIASQACQKAILHCNRDKRKINYHLDNIDDIETMPEDLNPEIILEIMEKKGYNKK
jgi:DNA-directed RNA polymerase specialized sigma24 family protein